MIPFSAFVISLYGGCFKGKTSRKCCQYVVRSEPDRIFVAFAFAHTRTYTHRQRHTRYIIVNWHFAGIRTACDTHYSYAACAQIFAQISLMRSRTLLPQTHTHSHLPMLCPLAAAQSCCDRKHAVYPKDTFAAHQISVLTNWPEYLPNTFGMPRELTHKVGLTN